MNIPKVFASLQHSKSFCFKTFEQYHALSRNYHKIANEKSKILTSKKVRQLFLDYFMQEKNHTYVHSSSVFLNNDPSLLFVNAGMNQFRSLLLNRMPPSHPFSKLKRAANSQKCIRLSGKHNDLDDVGQDLHHHTFFEMLGNWSFGDYSKKEACEMAWELLTKIYQINPENLYITYFGGCETLGVPADEECKNIWLDIGVQPNHIFPFVNENFWEMADFGPCGPCTEIHYDFMSSGYESAGKRINADKPDLIELWNLVFIQYNREQNGCLKPIPTLNVDTGIGFERLNAVLQGSMSNYDTDIFIPLFKAIEKNFNVRPYEGKTDLNDSDGIDTAYRILADHSRMFSVAIADGLFPDSFDAGHILRKIIRRASYAANKTMKSHPGVLSSLVPVVADSLDFFPEVTKNIKEIVDIVNEEEKFFHQLVNRGRKARNKMMSESQCNVLNGHQVYQLRQHYGLEEVIVKDLASEINMPVDWEEYQKVCEKKKISESHHFQDREDIFSALINKLKEKGIGESCDFFKYDHFTNKNNYGVQPISAKVVGIAVDKNLVTEAVEGSQCLIVTDLTNFYSAAGGQISDVGKIYNKDFTFIVDDVFSTKGYIFHKGIVAAGTLYGGCTVTMSVDKDHRLGCSQNHTATHLLNSTLRKILLYTSQRSSYVGFGNLRLGFSSKSPLTLEQTEEIERTVNEIIKKKITVKRVEMAFQELIDNPKAAILRGEEYPETVSVISVCSDEKEILSLEPCCGTHVQNTSDIDQLIIIPSKSHGGSTRYLNAVTGKQAALIHKNGEEVLEKVIQFIKNIDEMTVVSEDSISSLLKEIKKMIKDCQSMQNAPLIMLKKCERLLQDLKLKLNDMLTSSLSSNENVHLDSFPDASKIDSKVTDSIIQLLLSKNIPVTDDDYKYKWNEEGLKPTEAKVLAVIRNNETVSSVNRGLNCQLILDKTNFYSSDDDQAGDIGIIHCKDFILKVNNVYKANGFVFHDGYVEEGTLHVNQVVKTMVNEEHRLACSQNHTALHILNTVLKEELPYSHQLFALAGSKELVLTFSSKAGLSDMQLQNIERKVNEAIKANLRVMKTLTPVMLSNQFPAYKINVIKKYDDFIPTISIGNDEKEHFKSVEPCCGTHVSSTAAVRSFIITSSKSKSTKEKNIRAVTGTQAELVEKDGEIYENSMVELEEYVSSCLTKEKLDFLELWDCLKDVKLAKANHETELPLVIFRKHQNILSELSKSLTAATHDFVQQGFKKVASEMQKVLNENSDKHYIIHNLQSVGDGKKIINHAIDSSQNKPAMYFARDGYKSVICSCHVPKHLVHSTFSALLWINPVASILGGKARALTKDPELLYSVVCPKTDNLDKAVEIAKQFIESNLITNIS